MFESLFLHGNETDEAVPSANAFNVFNAVRCGGYESHCIRSHVVRQTALSEYGSIYVYIRGTVMLAVASRRQRCPLF